MNETDNETDNVSVWTPYEPDDDAPWNLQRVVHLHRRVVFGACWSEIQRDLAEGPEAAVSRVMDGTVRAEGVPEGFEQTSCCSNCICWTSVVTIAVRISAICSNSQGYLA